MSDWFFLEEADYNEILRLSRLYHREAGRCGKAKAYVAGCAMAGAALEAALLAMLHLYGEEVQAAGFAAMKKGQPKQLLEWTLAEMLAVAVRMEWLPAALPRGATWSTRKARIGDYAEWVRQLRNLIHPARYLRDHSPARVTRGYAARSLEIFEAAGQHLLARVEVSMRKDLHLDE